MIPRELHNAVEGHQHNSKEPQKAKRSSVTWDDFSHLEYRKGPTPSIR